MQVQAVNYTVLKKLSTKTICGEIGSKLPFDIVKNAQGEEEIKLRENAEVALYDVVGYITGVKTGETDKGVWTAFLGGFQCINLKNKKVYRSGTYFAPPLILDMFLPEFQRVGQGAAIKFGARVGIRVDLSAATKYVFTAETIGKAAENDPISMIAAEVYGDGSNLIAGPTSGAQDADTETEASESHNPETGEVVEGRRRRRA